MASFRTPLFVLALVLLALVVSIEASSTWLLDLWTQHLGPLGASSPQEALGAIGDALPAEFRDLAPSAGEVSARRAELQDLATPGLGIRALALIDGLLLVPVVLMGISLVLPHRVHGRVQGAASLVVSIGMLLGAIAAGFAALALVFVMIALLLSVPFGTIAYFIIYGFFDRTAATGTLGVIFSLKLGFCASLVAAHPAFLQNKSLVLMTATSLLASLVVGFLHGLVPLPLVSITDGVAAIVVAVLAAVWALLMLIGSLISVVKAVA